MVDIKRSLKIKYDIDTNITYDDFISDNSFAEDIKSINESHKLKDGYYYIGNYLRVGLCLHLSTNLDFNLGNKILPAVSCFFQYDIEEIYKDMPDDALQNIEHDIGEKHNMFPFDPLDLVQVYLSIEKQYNTEPFSLPFFLNNIEYYTQLNDEDFMGIVLRHIQSADYEVKKKPNYAALYTVFSILINKVDIYFVYNGPKEIIICSEHLLGRNINNTSIVVNLTKFFISEMGTETKNLLLPIRGLYESSHQSIGSCVKDIIKHFEKTKNIEVNIIAREKDLNKIRELDQEFPDTDIGFGRHRGKKDHIKLERKFIAKDKKYKRSGNESSKNV